MTEPSSSQQLLLSINHINLHAFTVSLLVGNGVSSSDAQIISHALILADLRGHDTHGTSRLPSYLSRIRAGILNPSAIPELSVVTPVVAHIDAKNGFGFVAAHKGIQWGIEAAKVYGIAMVSVKHSNHFGMSAWICEEATRADMMSMVFTNSSPALLAWGGKEKVLGCSPIACGAPSGKAPAFILDFAPSVVARGKIHKALRRGEKIPEGWALDNEGKDTTDPAAALDGGTMLPMGGFKGVGLAVMMDAFSGVLSGSAFAGGVTGPYDTRKEADVGHFFVVVKPDLFMGLDEFKERMDTLYRSVVESQKKAGTERIYFPGEIEQITRAEREEKGIPMVQAEIVALNEEAELAGIEKLVAT